MANKRIRNINGNFIIKHITRIINFSPITVASLILSFVLIICDKTAGSMFLDLLFHVVKRRKDSI